MTRESILISSPLEPEQVERIRALAPDRAAAVDRILLALQEVKP
jgi:hypothetical protein